MPACYKHPRYVIEYGGLANDPIITLSGNRTIAITAILLITGLQFEAVKVNNIASLKWGTVIESNTLSFDVLQSTDGSRFVKTAGSACGQKQQSETIKIIKK